MKTLRTTAAAIGLMLTATTAVTPAHAAPLPEWYGTYVWEEPLGRIGGDSPSEGVSAFITYTLTLGRGAGSTGCTLNAEGYQTYRQMQCTATPEMSSVVIKYYEFAPRNSGYRSGQRLFTMSRTARGLITQLQALRPSSDLSPSVGRLFRPA